MDNIKVNPGGEPAFISHLHSKGRALGLPVGATFELTSRCNFNCKMCYVHSAECGKNISRELTAAQWIEIGRQARDSGTVMALLTGGEPLIRDDFYEIYSAYKEMGMLVSVNTNASLLRGKTAELLKKNPPSRLNVSLYGASGETYKNLCGADYFETVMNNIKDMVASGVQLRINLSITPSNSGELEQMLKIASELGVHAKGTTYMYPPVRKDKGMTGINPGRFTAREAAEQRVRYDLLRLGRDEFLKRADNFSKKQKEYAEPPEAAQGDIMKCRAGSSSFWVDWQGNMTACGMLGEKGYNIIENGFDFCWQKVKEDTGKVRTPAKCVGCRYRALCPMCAAVCMSETGEYDKVPDYACEFSRYCAEYILETAERIR